MLRGAGLDILWDSVLAMAAIGGFIFVFFTMPLRVAKNRNEPSS